MLAAPPVVASPVARLRAVVDELAALDPADIGDEALASELLALRRQMDRQDAVFARWAHAGHQRGIGARDGAPSTAAWLRHRARMRHGEAKAAIDAGRLSELLPATGAAWRAGEIPTHAVRMISAARVPEHDDKLIALEHDFLDLARRGELRTLRRATAHFRQCALADGLEPSQYDGVFISQGYDGRTTITGELSDLAAETVTTALHAYTDPPEVGDPRTSSKRTADALVRVCEVALAQTGTPERPRAQVSVVVDWETLVDRRPGRLDGEFTGPLHPRDIELLLCDCDVSRVVTGPDSLPLDVGRTRRTVPRALRRALVARDRGCRYPGCGLPAGWCDAHHLVPWQDGGPTSLSNLALFCPHHHHVIHQPGWRVAVEGSDLRIHRPDGAEVAAEGFP